MARKLLKALFLFTTTIILCLTASILANAEVYSGDCSATDSNITWSVNTETGVLKFDGKGYMTNYQSSWDLPWLSYQNYITTAEIGADIIHLDDMTFFECHNLTSITVHEDNDNYSSLDGVLFNKDKTILYFCPVNYQSTTYTIPYGVELCDICCFSDSRNLEHIKIPDTVTEISNYTFNGIKTIKQITIPASVKKIGLQVFQGCDNLENIYVDEDSEYYTSVDGVLFTKDMTVLFQYPAGNERTSYSIPDSVEVLEAWSLYHARNLTSLKLPSNLVEIGWEAIIGCNDLKELYIPAGLETIYSHLSGNRSLERITVDEKNEHLCDIDGVLYTKDMKKLLSYPEAKKDTYYRIPDGVEEVQQGVFIYSWNLHEVFVPASIKVIEAATFYAIEHIMYPGTKEQWCAIEFGYSTEDLKDSSRVHLNYNPNLNHKKEKIVESHCNSAGTITITCSCGYVYSQNYLPLTEHINENDDAFCDYCNFQLREQTVFEKFISWIKDFFESIFDIFRF